MGRAPASLTPKAIGAAMAGLSAAQAENWARDAMGAVPADAGLRLALMQALRRIAPEAALRLFREAPADRADDPALGVEAAMLLDALKRAPEAAALMARLALLHPADGKVAAMRAVLAAKAGDHALAVEAYAVACRASPADMLLRVRLARSLRDAKRPAEAVAALDGVPSSVPQAMAERAYALLAMGDLARSGREIAELARLHPGFAHLDRLTAQQAEALGDMPGAAEAYARAMVIEPGNAGLLAGRWRCLRLAGDAAGLAALLEAAPAAAQADIRAALFETLVEDKACEAAEAVLAGWGDDAVARLRATVLLALRRGQHARAAAHAAAILARKPGDGWALWRQAEALALDFRADAAWTRLRRLEARGALGRRTARNNAIGHLVNDMRLDPAATALLAGAVALPPEDAMAVASALVRQAPGATAPALALLRAWRRPPGMVVTDDASPIPRCLHRVEEPGGPQEARLLALHPGMVAARWTPERLLARGAGVLPQALAAAFRLAPSGGLRLDLLRLGVLVLEGGIWVEAGLVPVAPLCPLLPPGAGLVLAADLRGAVGAALIATRPGHEVLRAALVEACDEVIGGSRESAWLTTGGGLLTRHVAAALAGRGGADIVLHAPEWLGRHLRPLRRVPWQRAMGDWAAEA